MIHFLLTPDQSSSFALKRKLAEQAPGCGIIAGTWYELLRLLRNAFLLPPASDRWQTQLETAIHASKETFWIASLDAVPSEHSSIIAIIGKTLTMLMEAAGPSGDICRLAPGALSVRGAQHLHDLTSLHRSMGATLPPHLELISQILDSPPACQLSQVHVYNMRNWPELNAWQHALLQRLNQSSHPTRRYTELLQQSVFAPSAPEHSFLGTIQQYLFQAAHNKVARDPSLQCLAVRDHLQEAEIAAGMVQQALMDNPSWYPADVALLLPRDQRYHSAVRDSFTLAGFPLSGLRIEHGLRDIGSETIELLLLSLRKPAPVLALTSLLTSPLMPWERSRGNQLAQQVMQGDFGFREWTDSAEGARLILTSLHNPPETSTDLARLLQRLHPHLDASDSMEMHHNRATTVLKRVIAALQTASSEIPWNELSYLCTFEPLPQHAPERTREGIAVFYEGEEPWRQVKRLLVLGCSEGHYPAPVGRSPVLSENDLKRVAEKWGCATLTAASNANRLREVFRRQLCSASDAVTLLVPHRDPLGNPLSPSSAITFIVSHLLGEGNQAIDQDAFVLELETNRGRNEARGLALVADRMPKPPRRPLAGDLCFTQNLLEIDKREDGSLKPESPSRLETLMVSPLAWLFERLGISARDWAPETLDVMTKGTLAHAVFEGLFVPGPSLPDPASVNKTVPVLLTQVIRSHCPFLQQREWMVEREQLQKEIVRAAERWAEILASTRAEILATEIGLQGMLDDVPIHGNADLLLSLPGNRLYVVDYKKSGSATRWQRMNKGYDHQTALYRIMIRTGGLKRPEKARAGLAAELAAYQDSGEIGAMYFLMNDQNVLTDTKGWLPEGIGGVQEMGEAIADASMSLIGTRFSELREGRIILNRPEDEDEFKKNRGITPYALDSSPLVRKFMKKDSDVI